MLGNISYERKIGKSTKLLFEKQGKINKKREDSVQGIGQVSPCLVKDF